MNFHDVALGTLYGVIQGLTEFLPVSSSGHLALLPFFGHFKDPGIAFDLAMHVGTAFAVSIYFFSDLKKICADFFLFLKKRGSNYFAINFMIATVVSIIFAFVLKRSAEELGRNPMLIAFNMIFFGLLLFCADRFGKKGIISFDDKSSKKPSFWIGLAQVMAIFPGVSRSGATISCARIFGASRVEASRFSFLLSLPLILGGAFLKFCELSKSQTETIPVTMSMVGLLVSFITGLLTIHYFMKLIAKIDFKYFFIYRLVLGVLIVVVNYN